ncbi:RNA polymerase sigma factor [Evansella tamaricis]|uniref:RNA polymerase sigma factor n=1 Tax=Evansella tamaricis TaxID=2069301 RepID=A0ABS6JQ09_9BACI|nr:RNA polymerase sigma factor [Evansella tamaricis]MBU9714907.1 RNA polymerase sigma factor [Evansella tamaricis]
MARERREEELMTAYQAGDRDALDAIYWLMKDSLYSFLYRYTRDEQLSIDIVQDTFVKLQQHKHQYDPAMGKLKPYLFQIAYRLMVNKLNRRKKLKSFFPSLVPITKTSIDMADRMTIREAIGKLPPKQRAIILLYYYHDLPQEEIAVILEIPLGTVKSRLHHGIHRLKALLGGDFLEA